MKRTLGHNARDVTVLRVKKVTATELRGRLRHRLGEVRDNRVLLVQNRRQKEKYVVDKDWLDSLVKERESVMATLEILADRKLTERLLALSKTIDADVATRQLLSIDEVFS
jgi:CHAD domain-containing protein